MAKLEERKKPKEVFRCKLKSPKIRTKPKTAFFKKTRLSAVTVLIKL